MPDSRIEAALGNVEYACMVETPSQEWQASLATIRAEVSRLTAEKEEAEAMCEVLAENSPCHNVLCCFHGAPTDPHGYEGCCCAGDKEACKEYRLEAARTTVQTATPDEGGEA